MKKLILAAAAAASTLTAAFANGPLALCDQAAVEMYACNGGPPNRGAADAMKNQLRFHALRSVGGDERDVAPACKKILDEMKVDNAHKCGPNAGLAICEGVFSDVSACGPKANSAMTNAEFSAAVDKWRNTVRTNTAQATQVADRAQLCRDVKAQIAAARPDCRLRRD